MKTLQSWEEPIKAEFHVKFNYCNCHPETCCCNPYAVFRPDGTKLSTFYREETAIEVAEAMNKVKGP